MNNPAQWGGFGTRHESFISHGAHRVHREKMKWGRHAGLPLQKSKNKQQP